jgi:hypothetical protein
MPVFRIHRMKDPARQHFLWAPHVSGAAGVKPKDYDSAEDVEAENEYAAWSLSRHWEKPLLVGDILELPSGALRICKYVGFEEARWVAKEEPANPVSPVPLPVPQSMQA